MKVAYLQDSLLCAQGGSSFTSILTNLTDHLERSGIDFRVYASEIAAGSDLAHRAIRVDLMPEDFFPDEHEASTLRKSFYDYLDQFQPELLHLTEYSLLSVLGLNYARDNKLPVIFSSHRSEHELRAAGSLADLPDPQYLRWFHSRCDTTLVPEYDAIFAMVEFGIRNLHLWPARTERSLLAGPHCQQPAWSGAAATYSRRDWKKVANQLLHHYLRLYADYHSHNRRWKKFPSQKVMQAATALRQRAVA